MSGVVVRASSDVKQQLIVVGAVGKQLQQLALMQTTVALDLLETNGRLSELLAQKSKFEGVTRVLRSELKAPDEKEIKRLQSQQSALEQKRIELAAQKQQLISSLPPAWQKYLSPALDVDMVSPHARGVAKYVPLSVALKRLEDPVRSAYTRQQFPIQLLRSAEKAKADQQIAVNETKELYTRLRDELYEEDLDEEEEEEEKELRVQEQRSAQREREEKGDVPKRAYDMMMQEVRLDILSKRLSNEKLHFSALVNQLVNIKINAALYVRTTVGSFLPPLSELDITFIWEYSNKLLRSRMTFGKTPSAEALADFWLMFALIMNTGKLVALVTTPKRSDFSETIYPIQGSILFAPDVASLPLTDGLLERLIKLPNETADPDLWAVIVGAAVSNEARFLKGGEDELKLTLVEEGKYKSLPIQFEFLVTSEIQKDETYLSATGSDERHLLSDTSAKGMMAFWKTQASIVKQVHMEERNSLSETVFLRLPPLLTPVDLFSLPTVLLNRNTTPREAFDMSKFNTSPGVELRNTPKKVIKTMWLQVWLVTAAAWLPTSSYKVNDLVTFQGKTYRFRGTVSSPNSTAPSASAGWEIRLPLLNEYEVVPCFMDVVDASGYLGGIHVTVFRPFWSTKPSPNWACMDFSAYAPNATDEDSHKLHESQVQAASDFKALVTSSAVASESSERSFWQGETHYINSTGGCDNIILRPGVSKGGIFVNISKQLANIFNLDYLLLTDASSVTCPGTNKEMYLRLLNTIKEGIPWYSRFGFVLTGNRKGYQFAQYLAQLPWEKLRTAVTAILKPNDTEERQSIEALTCATAPVGCAKSAEGACVSHSKLRDVADMLGRRVCTNYSVFLDIFDRTRTEPLLKQLGVDKQFNVDEIRAYFHNATRMIWIRRLSALSDPLITLPPAAVAAAAAADVDVADAKQPEAKDLAMILNAPPPPMSSASLGGGSGFIHRFGGGHNEVKPIYRRFHVRLKY